MSKKPAHGQTAFEIVTPDNLLRKMDAAIDFSSIHHRVAGPHCTGG